MTETYYKVVTTDLTSLGLRRNPTILEYKLNKWVKSPTVIEGNSDNGGIWVVKTKSNANKLIKYMKKMHKINCLMFKAKVGKILYENSYRIKVDKVKIYE